MRVRLRNAKDGGKAGVGESTRDVKSLTDLRRFTFGLGEGLPPQETDTDIQILDTSREDSSDIYCVLDLTGMAFLAFWSVESYIVVI